MKKALVLTVCLTLAFALVLAGCQYLSYLGISPAETLPQAIEVRPQKEIEETGITAEDVLAVYDQLATIAGKYLYSDMKEQLGEDYYKIEARFVSITPPTEYQTKTGFLSPAEGCALSFYPFEEWYTSPAHWLNNNNMYDVYKLNLNTEIAYKGRVSREDYGMLPLPSVDFELIAQAFGAKELKITPEYIEQEYNRAGVYPQQYDGYNAYSSFIITRETIMSASEEQLWALYNAATKGFLTQNFGSTEAAYAILEESQSN